MKKNIGSIERVIRIMAGAGILSLAFVGPQSPWAYLGIVPLATGLAGVRRMPYLQELQITGASMKMKNCPLCGQIMPERI